ncbi:triose-phosphate transporter family-domain-containing protein [Obelidium mucronatum]|nr:triose-phosphate transporter family-domain-containing protein [Obelidium mucronatum]
MAAASEPLSPQLPSHVTAAHPPPYSSQPVPSQTPSPLLQSHSRVRTNSANMAPSPTRHISSNNINDNDTFAVDLFKPKGHIIGPKEKNLSILFGGSTSASSSIASFQKHAHWVENAQFIALCLLWYFASSVTSNMAKDLLNVFKYPLTLSWIQFLFVASGCLILTFIQRYLFGIKSAGIRLPSIEAFRVTAPLSLFLISGHAFSSMAISRVPVSFAHTIKALSPLFTIGIYRFVFNVQYANKVYISLLPLTIGVMLVCTNKLTFHLLGFLCALTSTIIFVVQNIVSKAIFNKQATVKKSKKMDKYNLLFYSSVTSFLLMAPLWFYADGLSMFGGDSKTAPSFGPISSFATSSKNASSSSTTAAAAAAATASSSRITATTNEIIHLFLINGISHFAQAALSFSILAQVHNPVTFSIASLFKRIVVIVASIIYFGETSRVGPVQWFGLILTFAGLYMYDRAGMEVKNGGGKSLGGHHHHQHHEEEDVELLNGGRRKQPVLPI